MKNGKIDYPIRESSIGELFGTINCLELITDIEGFSTWIGTQHNLKINDSILQGYKFMIETNIRCVITSIRHDNLFFSEDFIYHRANFVGIPISDIPNSCEKAIITKNFNRYLRSIKKSENVSMLTSSLGLLRDEIIVPFLNYFDNYVNYIGPTTINKSEYLNYLSMFFSLIYLNDTKKSYPFGYLFSPMKCEINEEKLHSYLIGYKYSLEYLWFRLIGDDYNNSPVRNIHTAMAWSDNIINSVWDFGNNHDDEVKFIDLNEEIGDLILPNIMSQNNSLNKEDLDKYFDIINTEIIRPLEDRIGIHHYSHEYFEISKPFSLELYPNLLKQKKLEIDEFRRFKQKLLWYQIDLTKNSKNSIFNGIPHFITLLLGTAELYKNLNLEKKIIVCKFVHKNENGNDYSYGILLESHGLISDYSGWQIFFNCCHDYSGFANSMHMRAESQLSNLLANDFIILNEMDLSKEEFLKYVSDYIVSDNREDIRLILKQTDNLSQLNEKLSESKGLLLELLSSYLASMRNDVKVEWNKTINKMQYDIIYSDNYSICFIECKFNINNYSIQEVVLKLKKKAMNYKTNLEKSVEIWVWVPPTPESVRKLNEYDIKYEVVSDKVLYKHDLGLKKLDKLKNVMN